ncbi:MAG TPA: alkaline phosphatase [Armatimonadota bacterium]|jgi:alkaline phosphatase
MTRTLRRLKAALALSALVLTPACRAAPSLRILPPDGAVFAVSQRFDLRVEAKGLEGAVGELEVRVNGKPLEQVRRFLRSSSAAGAKEVTAREVHFREPGPGLIQASLRTPSGTVTASSTFYVVPVGGDALKARNVILMIGDGMGLAHREAARVVGHGLVGGRYRSHLEMEDMETLALASTSSLNSFVTDSANGATAYAGGNKTDNGALCAWADNTSDPVDNPRMENLMEYARREVGVSVGVVTTASVVDATPAAFLAHCYERGKAQEIAGQYPASAPDVLLGGGRDVFSKALRARITGKGGRYVSDRQGLLAVPANTSRLLGLFSASTMTSVVDRTRSQEQGKGAGLKEPSLVDMTEAALKVLSAKPRGFVLMVEGASIDKQSHGRDPNRAVWEALEFDRAVGVAKRFAAEKGDTLVIVTADHETGGMTLTGLDTAQKQLTLGWGQVPLEPGTGMTEPEYTAPPKVGGLGHTAADVPVTASGPGASQIRGVLDATDVFFAMVRALCGGYEGAEAPSREQ